MPLNLAARPGRKTMVEPSVEIRGQACLGISGANQNPAAAETMELNEETESVIVPQVTAVSPADEAGIRGSIKPFNSEGMEILIGGDVITSVDEPPVETITTLSRLIG